jgi:ParB family transcriptional regulator, chromosome partitioning protein
MSKLDEMRRMTASNVDDSMGVGRPVVHGAQPASGPSAPTRWQGVSKSRNAAEIPVSKIGPDPDQPREEFEAEALHRLADSLRTRGQIQPISVRWVEDREQYVIVCGERRWRAAGLAGLPTLSCVVLDKPVPPGELLAMQLVENLLREDLQPIEQAHAYRALMDGNGWTVSQVARELAVDHSNVSRALALLSLPASVQEQVEQGTLPPATAYEVSKLEDPEAQQTVAARVVSEKLSRAETVEAVRQASSKPARTSKGRGASQAKARPLPKEWTHKTASGFKVVVSARKGFDARVWAETLEEAAREARAKADEASLETATRRAS